MHNAQPRSLPKLLCSYQLAGVHTLAWLPGVSYLRLGPPAVAAVRGDYFTDGLYCKLDHYGS